MRVRFTRNALQDLDDVFSYIGQHSASRAANAKMRILEVISPLKRFPRIGTPTDKEGIRMLVATPYPYLVFYETNNKANEVVIHHIRHAKRERDA